MLTCGRPATTMDKNWAGSKATTSHSRKHLSQPFGHKGMEATEATGLFPGAQSSEHDGQHEEGPSARAGAHPSAMQENRVAFFPPNMKMAAKGSQRFVWVRNFRPAHRFPLIPVESEERLQIFRQTRKSRVSLTLQFSYQIKQVQSLGVMRDWIPVSSSAAEKNNLVIACPSHILG